MLDHHATLLALRTRLRATQVVTTGVGTFGAGRYAFTRTSGSFVDDGFRVGMEVTPTGFADNRTSIVNHVEETVLVLRDSRQVESPEAGRSLTVGIPTVCSWENQEAEPSDDHWFLNEDYLPGVPRRITNGAFGEFQTDPAYVLKVHGFKNTGAGALYAMSDAILKMFPPSYAMILADGVVLRVHSNPGPYRGQIMYDEDGFAFITITIPLWARTRNLI